MKLQVGDRVTMPDLEGHPIGYPSGILLHGIVVRTRTYPGIVGDRALVLTTAPHDHNKAGQHITSIEASQDHFTIIA